MHQCQSSYCVLRGQASKGVVSKVVNKGEQGVRAGLVQASKGFDKQASKGGEQDDEPDLEPRHESVQRAEQSRPQQKDCKVKETTHIYLIIRMNKAR